MTSQQFRHKNPMTHADVFSLNGQLALVTGGATGLGRAISQALIEAGAQVIITGRRAGPLEQAAAELGPAAHALRHDVTDLDSIPPLVEQIESQFQPLDILVNNAGIHIKKGALDTTDGDLAEMMQTHVAGAFALSRACGARMIARRQGSIIMILSMAALFGIPQIAAYSTAKSALIGLTRSLTAEFSPHGVRVNAIAPGWIETNMSRTATKNDPERLQKIMGRTPLGRFGQPSDIGHAAVYLCAPAAQFVTGAILPVDGGASIGF